MIKIKAHIQWALTCSDRVTFTASYKHSASIFSPTNSVGILEYRSAVYDRQLQLENIIIGTKF